MCQYLQIVLRNIYVHNFKSVRTLSTIKSIASIIFGSTLLDTKFPINILFKTKAGKIQNIAAES